MKITKSITPRNRKAWRKWLEKNHNREREVWLVYFKSSSGKSGIDYESSVQEALCFGWIDSLIQKIDDEKYARKFNPRRADSRWSEVNKRRAALLVREGRMTPAGLARVAFDIRRVDPSRPKPAPLKPMLKIPQKVARALKARTEVWAAFQKVPPALKRNYIRWLMDARKQETFERRLNLLIQEVLSGKPTSMH